MSNETDDLTDEQFAEMVKAQCSPAAKRIAELEREIASLRGQLSLANHHARGRWGDYERAMEDKARLDWLENPTKCYYVCIDSQPHGESIYNMPPSQDAVRAAIDRARSA